METSTAVSAGSLAVAAVAALASLYFFIRNRTLQLELNQLAALQANSSALTKIWEALSRNESLLRFHSISPKELADAGINLQDLAYSVSHFEAGAYFYEHIDRDTGPFPIDSLRFQLLSSKATRDAWVVIKKFFPSDLRYTKRVQETISKHWP